MRKLFLILAIAFLSIGCLFAQTVRTEINATQMITEGIIVGPSVLHTAAEVTLMADDCKGQIHINADADPIDFTLPPAALGLSVGFLDAAGGAITGDLFDGVDKIWINGVDGGAGNEMVSDGTIGRYIVLVCLDATSWFGLPVEVDTWGIP